MQARVPRLIIAGSHSGSGKTSLTCALLMALKQRGLDLAAFKLGPDYLDPLFQRQIIGARTANLDQYFFSDQTIFQVLARHGQAARISLIEGVMGFYDGLSFSQTKASTYELARLTRSPVVLVLDARGAALSVLATLRGFLDFRPDNQLAGLVLNRVSPMTYRLLADQVRAEFGGRIRPLGYLPESAKISLPSRSLGLVVAEEVPDLQARLDFLGDLAADCLDLGGVIDLADTAPALEVLAEAGPAPLKPVKIGLARDRAFCLYYEDNLEYLRRLGADLVEFSPLESSHLPEDLDGIYIGGGYPELYLDQLSANRSLRQDLNRRLAAGLPCLAEGGGFMYLQQKLAGRPMVAFLPGECEKRDRLVRFGYIELEARTDNLLARAGEKIRAHEYHYWDSDQPGQAFRATKPSGKTWTCIQAGPTYYAGFPQIHFYSNPQFALNFYRKCLEARSHVRPD